MPDKIKRTEKQSYKQKTLRLLLAFAAFSVILITGCDLSSIGSSDTTKGVLKVSINSSRLASRSVLPETDMTPTEYRITGTGPTNGSFERITTDSTINVYDLETGSWTLTVAASNAAGQQIGWGESIVTVGASITNDVSVLVEPYSGKGSVALSVSWNDTEVNNPTISATLTDAAEIETELPFDIGTGTASYSNSDISAGYYTLTINLLDDGTTVSGLVETVRILQDFETTADFNFTDLNNPTGDVSISVIVDMLDPFEPVINGASAALTYGSDMTVSAAVPDSDGETLTYKWFSNGELVGSSETITFGSTLRWGSYRLDLVVTNADGSRSGSAAHYFTIE